MVNLWNNYHRSQSIDPGGEVFKDHALANPPQVPQTPHSHCQRKADLIMPVFAHPPNAK